MYTMYVQYSISILIMAGIGMCHVHVYALQSNPEYLLCLQQDYTPI